MGELWGANERCPFAIVALSSGGLFACLGTGCYRLCVNYVGSWNTIVGGRKTSEVIEMIGT